MYAGDILYNESFTTYPWEERMSACKGEPAPFSWQLGATNYPGPELLRFGLETAVKLLM